MSRAPILDVHVDITYAGQLRAVLSMNGRMLGSLQCTPHEFEQLQMTLLYGDKGWTRGGAGAIFHMTEAARRLREAEAATRDRDIFQDGGAK